MVKRTGTQLRSLKNLIISLKQTKIPVWKRVASDLEKPTRQRREVNLYTINKTIKDGETAVIPGKVLSIGSLDKAVTVAAFRFSAEAKEKINKKGKAISIVELLKSNPQGKKVRILG